MSLDILGPKSVIIIGLMSGTSADGIDAAVLRVEEADGAIQWELLSHSSTPWPEAVRQAILDSCRPDAPLQQICALNSRLGYGFAEAAICAAAKAGLTMSDIAAIASHGQTVWHQPVPFEVGGGKSVGTVQLGEPAVIAKTTGCLVVSDFRAADMAAGGQGAPLVPFTDYLLFADSQETRVVQNIGGIANATLLPAGGVISDVVAFDTGPGNMVMDALALRLSGGRRTCDHDGMLAGAGRPNSGLLGELMAHPYFACRPPKSTGREDFGVPFADALYARASAIKLSAEDIMATALALTVESIACAYRDLLGISQPIDRVILGGGGTHNPLLLARLRDRLMPAVVVTHADYGVADSAKEALAFALLGYHTLRGRPSNVCSATGATHPAVLGNISIPPPRQM